MIKNKNYDKIYSVIRMNFEDIKKLKDSLNIEVTKANKNELLRLKNKAKTLKDTRVKKKCTYKLWDIVCVVILAVLSNCNEWEEIYYFAQTHKKWLKNFLKLTGGIPQPSTYERVISIIDSSELNNICVEFMFRMVQIPINPQYDFYHFDGKVDKSSGRKTNSKNEVVKNLNVLNVYSDLLSMCIDQEMIEEKTNEITAIPDVINRLNIKGVICTWDALNTQKNTVKSVIEGKGDYVGALKGNQGTFYQDVIDYFDEDRLLLIQSQYEGAYKKELEKSHSQVITYEYYQTEKVNWYPASKEWEGLKSIGLVIKTSENKNGEKTIEKRYYISSLLLDIYNFSKAIRNHWNVENKLHWQLDFTFKADENTTVNKKALFNLQIIKKFALNILNLVKDEYKCSLKKIRFQIGLNAPKELEKIFKILSKKGKN